MSPTCAFAGPAPGRRTAPPSATVARRELRARPGHRPTGLPAPRAPEAEKPPDLPPSSTRWEARTPPHCDKPWCEKRATNPERGEQEAKRQKEPARGGREAPPGAGRTGRGGAGDAGGDCPSRQPPPSWNFARRSSYQRGVKPPRVSSQGTLRCHSLQAQAPGPASEPVGPWQLRPTHPLNLG